ncbi:MAG: glycosyltransferase family 9 protein [Acidobacteriota bacterium]|nr:glycosyltransferase family 9 protein [Acidobacteriota bacterium]
MPLQTDSLNRLASNSRVAVIRLRSLGDCVLSTPAIHLLKRHRPDLKIAVVAEERFAGVYENNPDVAEILRPSIGALRAFGPKMCVNLHGGTRSARLTALSGAKIRAGLDIFRPAWPYNVKIPTAQEILGIARRVHTAEHQASTMFYLGVPVAEIPRAALYPDAGRSPFAPAGRYAVIHPFAATPEKTWPAQSFAAAAEALDIEPVFVGGPADDFTPFERWKNARGASLPQLAQLLRDAAVFIGNDSGPAHVAAAFGIPCVVLFGPSDAEIWSPWRTQSEVLRGEPIGSIGVEQVLRAAAGKVWVL